MTNPDLLVLDEATEGLAPVVRDEIWQRLRDLKSGGLSIPGHRQGTGRTPARSRTRHYILEKGEIVWTGTTAALLADASIHETYLGV